MMEKFKNISEVAEIFKTDKETIVIWKTYGLIKGCEMSDGLRFKNADITEAIQKYINKPEDFKNLKMFKNEKTEQVEDPQLTFPEKQPSESPKRLPRLPPFIKESSFFNGFEFYSTAKVMALTGLSEKQIKTRCLDNRLKYFTAKGKRWVDRKSVEKLIKFLKLKKVVNKVKVSNETLNQCFSKTESEDQYIKAKENKVEFKNYNLYNVPIKWAQALSERGICFSPFAKIAIEKELKCHGWI